MKKSFKGMRGDVMSVIYGTAAFLAVLVLGVLLTALAVYKEWFGEESAPYGQTISVLLSAISGALVAVRINRERRIVICLASLLVYFMIMVIVNIIVFGKGMSGVPATIGILAAGVTAVYALSITPKKRGFGRKIKM